MGTRGAYGFYKDGETKVTYNHYDSYLEGLGEDVVEFVRKTDIQKLNTIFDELIMVDEDGTPTKEQIQALEKWSDTRVSTGELTEWYVLLRNAQGNLMAFKEGLRYMIDGKGFLNDSLFCEYAYIINLDENVLEIYEGFNQNENAQGRYRSKPDRSGYVAVRPLIEFPLDAIPSNWLEQAGVLEEDEE